MRAVRIVRKRQKSNPKNFKIIKSYLTDLEHQQFFRLHSQPPDKYFLQTNPLCIKRNKCEQRKSYRSFIQ
jgi:hypothetical protein